MIEVISGILYPNGHKIPNASFRFTDSHVSKGMDSTDFI